MAYYSPTNLYFVQGNDTYVLRCLTQSEVTKIANALTAHQDISGKLDNVAVAAEYDETVSYESGDYCTHNGKLYKSILPQDMGVAPGPWSANRWQEVNVIDEMQNQVGQVMTAPEESGGQIYPGQSGMVPASNTFIGYLRGDATWADPHARIMAGSGMGKVKCQQGQFDKIKDTVWYSKSILSVTLTNTEGQLQIQKITGATATDQSSEPGLMGQAYFEHPEYTYDTQTLTLFSVASTAETQAIITEYGAVSE